MNAILTSEIAKLSPDERLTLIDEIWDTLDVDQGVLTKAQERELIRRLENFEEEKAHAVPWETVRAELRSRL